MCSSKVAYLALTISDPESRSSSCSPLMTYFASPLRLSTSRERSDFSADMTVKGGKETVGKKTASKFSPAVRDSRWHCNPSPVYTRKRSLVRRQNGLGYSLPAPACIERRLTFALTAFLADSIFRRATEARGRAAEDGPGTYKLL